MGPSLPRGYIRQVRQGMRWLQSSVCAFVSAFDISACENNPAFRKWISTIRTLESVPVKAVTTTIWDGGERMGILPKDPQSPAGSPASGNFCARGYP